MALILYHLLENMVNSSNFKGTPWHNRTLTGLEFSARSFRIKTLTMRHQCLTDVGSDLSSFFRDISLKHIIITLIRKDQSKRLETRQKLHLN